MAPSDTLTSPSPPTPYWFGRSRRANRSLRRQLRFRFRFGGGRREAPPGGRSRTSRGRRRSVGANRHPRHGGLSEWGCRADGGREGRRRIPVESDRSARGTLRPGRGTDRFGRRDRGRSSVIPGDIDRILGAAAIRDPKLFAKVLSLLTVRGDGHLVLRIGGTSADATFLDPPGSRLPKWEFGVTPGWLTQTSSLVRQLGARVIVDLNLVTDTPSVAARLAATVQKALPRGSVIGFEVGNEPDLYSHSYWEGATSSGGPDAPTLPAGISSDDYVPDLDAYAQTLARIAPDTPLIGPAAAYPTFNLKWISNLLSSPHSGLGLVSAHYYPYWACARPNSSSYPTVARLLSNNAAAGLAEAVTPAARAAHAAGLPFRLTELNSVTCGGVAGVSDTFATALWAPDALFNLVRAGVNGVNVHVREDAINGAFALRDRGLIARPLLYGMILFDRTLGPGAMLVPARVLTRRSLDLKAWAVQIDGGVLHVLLIDKTNRSGTVQLRLPTTATATVQRLLARSADARSCITLDGQQLGSDAEWHGRPSNETIAPDATGYKLAMAGWSAALVSVKLRLAGPLDGWPVGAGRAWRVGRGGFPSGPRGPAVRRDGDCAQESFEQGWQMSVLAWWRGLRAVGGLCQSVIASDLRLEPSRRRDVPDGPSANRLSNELLAGTEVPPPTLPRRSSGAPRSPRTGPSRAARSTRSERSTRSSRPDETT